MAVSRHEVSAYLQPARIWTLGDHRHVEILKKPARIHALTIPSKILKNIQGIHLRFPGDYDMANKSAINGARIDKVKTPSKKLYCRVDGVLAAVGRVSRSR